MKRTTVFGLVTFAAAAALLAAAMATTSANLNCLAAVFVEDYYGRLKPNRTDMEAWALVAWLPAGVLS